MRKSLVVSAIIVTLSLLTPTVVQAETKEANKDLEQVKVSTQFDPLTILDCNDKPLYAFRWEAVARAKSKKDGEVTLKCGYPKAGYVHIREKHQKDWATVTKDKKKTGMTQCGPLQKRYSLNLYTHKSNQAINDATLEPLN